MPGSIKARDVSRSILTRSSLTLNVNAKIDRSRATTSPTLKNRKVLLVRSAFEVFFGCIGEGLCPQNAMLRNSSRRIHLFFKRDKTKNPDRKAGAFVNIRRRNYPNLKLIGNTIF